jgi:hypothetical protein
MTDATDTKYARLAESSGTMAMLEAMRGDPNEAFRHAQDAAHAARIALAGRTATSCGSCGREPEDHGASRWACGHYLRHGERYIRPMPEGYCEVCFRALGTAGCTNQRCESCHHRYCTEGDGRGVVRLYMERRGGCDCIGFSPRVPGGFECECHHIVEDHPAGVLANRRFLFNTQMTFDPAKERLHQLTGE